MKSGIDIKDIFFFIGLILIGVGLWFCDWRISLIAIGTILSFLGFIGFLKRGK